MQRGVVISRYLLLKPPTGSIRVRLGIIVHISTTSYVFIKLWLDISYRVNLSIPRVARTRLYEDIVL
jgi:hypothetical protein